jgi:putative redox protein
MSVPSVRLCWSEGLVFTGGAEGGPEITVDSAGVAGPSPTQLLLTSLAGCMGVDIRMILEKGRVPVDFLEVLVEGDRVSTDPRRFESLRLTCRVRGPDDEDQPKLERAVQLSRDKYCSVLHTLRPDLDLVIHIERA